MRGTAKGVGGSAELWIVVYAPDIERFFPGDPTQKVIRRGETQWSGVAFVGSSKGVGIGDAYQLQIVSAAQAASRSMADFKRGASRDLGLQSLPSGAKVLASRFVTRDAC